MKAALTQSEVRRYAVYNLPGLNHQFQAGNKCTFFEPQYLDETISPFVLDLMGEWLKNGYQIKNPAFSNFLKSQKN